MNISIPEHLLWNALVENIKDATSLFKRQAPVDYYHIDILFKPQRVAIEVLGFAFHSTKEQFEKDAVRTRHLYSAGYMFLPFTAKQVENNPKGCALEIAKLFELDVLEKELSDEEIIKDVQQRGARIYGLLTADEVNDYTQYELNKLVAVFGKILDVRETDKAIYADLLCDDDFVTLQIFREKMRRYGNLIKKDLLVMIKGRLFYADRRNEIWINCDHIVSGEQIIEELE